jgi:hypothetical protein
MSFASSTKFSSSFAKQPKNPIKRVKIIDYLEEEEEELIVDSALKSGLESVGTTTKNDRTPVEPIEFYKISLFD